MKGLTFLVHIFRIFLFCSNKQAITKMSISISYPKKSYHMSTQQGKLYISLVPNWFVVVLVVVSVVLGVVFLAPVAVVACHYFYLL